jgi:hypothetical protein
MPQRCPHVCLPPRAIVSPFVQPFGRLAPALRCAIATPPQCRSQALSDDFPHAARLTNPAAIACVCRLRHRLVFQLRALPLRVPLNTAPLSSSAQPSATDNGLAMSKPRFLFCPCCILLRACIPCSCTLSVASACSHVLEPSRPSPAGRAYKRAPFLMPFVRAIPISGPCR